MCIKILRGRIQFRRHVGGCFLRHEGFNGVMRICKLLQFRLILRRTDAEQMEAVTEQTIVGPFARLLADRHHRNIIDQEHDSRQNRQTQHTAGDDSVDLVRRRQPAGVRFVVTILK